MVTEAATNSWHLLCRYDGSTDGWQVNPGLAPVLDAVDTGFLLLSATGTILHGNRFAASLLGLSPGDRPEAVLASRQWRLVDSDAAPLAWDQSPIGHCLQTGHPQPPTVMGLIPRDQPAAWVRLGCHPLFTPDQQLVSAVILTFIDITDQHRIEQDLKALGEKYRQLSDATFEAIFLSEGGICIGQNATARKLFGYSDQEAIGRHGTEWIHPDDRATVMARMRAGETAPYEVRAQRKDGSCFPCEIQARISHGPDGRAIRITALRDISERRATLDKLLQEARRRQILMAKSGDGIVITDSNHRVVEANQRFADMLGYPLASMTELHIWDWEVNRSEEEIRQSPIDLATLDHFFETRHRRRDGTVYDAEVQSSWAMIGGEPMAFAVVRDITRRKRDERELLLAKTKAEMASKHKSEFLANMSHEIRTPLNGMMGMLQLMQGEPLTPALREYLDNSLLASERLTRLLGDILDLSQVEAGMLRLHPVIFSPRETMHSLKALFAPAFLEKGIDLAIRFTGEPPGHLIGDVTRLLQILTNLVGNSLKFTEEGSVAVEVTPITTADPSQIRLLFSVTDTGIGIEDDKLATLFDPFVQVENSLTRRYQGAGLGLAIARHLITLLGGNMAISSEQGHGTTVNFSIPLALSLPPEPARPTSHPNSQSRDNLRILLAEDDPISQMVVLKLLTNFGHEVHTAQNGREVLDILQAMPGFDVLLIDIQMPVLNGVEVTRALRTDPSFRASATLPIVAMTAYAMTGDRESFLEAGMNGYLAKPIDPAALIEILATVAAARKNTTGTS